MPAPGAQVNVVPQSTQQQAPAPAPDRARAAPPPDGPAAAAAEALALAAVVGAPLAIGAVHLPIVLAVAAIGCLAFALLAHSLRGGRLHAGWLAAALLGVNAWTLLQLVPLPPGLLGGLAPATAALYEAAGAGGWRPLSLDAAATAAQAARGVG